MSNIAIVFWSGTGNTEAMADAVKAGAQEAGAEVSVFNASDFSADMVADFDAIAFGCPAMGDEVLEEDEFQPMFDAVLPSLSGKKIVAFRQEDSSFRLLRLGRRSVDARLAGILPKRGRISCLRVRDRK